ncbi:Gfo/Idh/MocA family protein [Saccharopolyspora gloriosae]|uniref:Gfo/Idh/MocA family protein n=1 Tax=Saccharopolyspora gloriosae TaxID=455344 RepID=UPI001FB5FA87|nr:Gfo/Idh/MocA family oxidoreductase [Saccharopolyspora gloriosae]
MSEALRVGIVGAGPWARRVHAPGLNAHPGMHLTAVWSRRPDTAKALAYQYDADVADGYDSLLDAVDAVAFAVPPAVQGELAVQAAREGKHLILEKPLAGDVPAAEAVANAVRQSRVAALVMLTRRFAPEVRDWLTGLGHLGGWTGGTAQWLAGGLLAGDYAATPWRQERTGALLDAGPHALDLLDAALGRINRVHHARRDESDNWQMAFEHASGASSTLTLSLRVPVQPALIEFTLYGTNGKSQLTGRRTAARECYAQLLDEFLAMIRSGRTAHPCDIRRGLHLQRVLDAVRLAAD